MKISIRNARPDELDWVNARYEEIQFVLSRMDRDTIVVAEYDGQRCGLGRIVSIDPNNVELGGIYVFPKFRGLGIAKQIVSHLIQLCRPETTVWCLPFQNLLPFYQEFGFECRDESTRDPPEINQKLQWCNDSFEQPVILMSLKENRQ